MKIIKKAVCVILSACLLFSLASCSSQPQSQKIDTSEVTGYSDAAVERMLTAINEKDYTKFSQDFDGPMKNALTEQKFNDVVNQMQNLYGNYQSKEIAGAEKTEKYTRAFYNCKYSKIEKIVTVTIVFSQSDGKTFISGFFYK